MLTVVSQNMCLNITRDDFGRMLAETLNPRCFGGSDLSKTCKSLGLLEFTGAWRESREGLEFCIITGPVIVSIMTVMMIITSVLIPLLL